MIGTVQYYDTRNRYGMVRPDGGLPDVFLHRSALVSANISSVQPEQRLEFDVVAGTSRGKIKAVNVRRLPGA